MIAVTCRNGEHFSVHPDSIERIETDPDTVVFLVDGTKYVVGESFDHVLRALREHRAATFVAAQRLGRAGAPPSPPDGPPRPRDPGAAARQLPVRTGSPER